MYIVGVLIFMGIYLVIHVIVKGLFNAADSGIDAIRKNQDQKAGKYEESKPENLADKYK